MALLDPGHQTQYGTCRESFMSEYELKLFYIESCSHPHSLQKNQSIKHY